MLDNVRAAVYIMGVNKHTDTRKAYTVKSPEFRTDLVVVANRRGGKSKIHRAECRYVAATDPFYVRPMRRGGEVSHRIYTVCGTCLKGLSTFRLPTEPVEAAS